MNLARLGNKYLADEEPWKVIKEDPKRVETIMNTALQIAAGLAILCEPFLPFTSTKLKSILGHSALDAESTWADISQNKALLPQGHKIGKSELLFSKIEDAEFRSSWTN